MHLERERESSKQKTFTISNIFFRTYSKDTKKVKNKQLKKKKPAHLQRQTQHIKRLKPGKNGIRQRLTQHIKPLKGNPKIQ